MRDRAVLHAILDAGLVAHLSVSDPDGQPYVVPVGYARDGERVLFHGSTGSRLFRGLAEGAPTCLTVTLLDGLVVARSLFESSMHYRSAMVLGTCTVIGSGSDGRDGDDGEKLDALRHISDHLFPGRWAEARQPNTKELAATMVLALPLDETSVKVSDGPPDDAVEDLTLPIWAGTLSLREVFGEPVAAPDLAFDLPVPDSVRGWQR